MPKTPPPMLGFNNNVRHQGRIFHIQTEDSGVKRPHVMTHLFGDGGRILKSAKTTYTEHLEREDLAQVVRQLMKDQHKSMFVALRGGELDDIIFQAFGPPPAPKPAPEAAAKVEPLAPLSAEPPLSVEAPLSLEPPLSSEAPLSPGPPPSVEAPLSVQPLSVEPLSVEPRPPSQRLPVTPSSPRISAVADPPPSRPAVVTPLRTASVVPARVSPPPRAGTPSLGSPSPLRPKSDPNAGRYSLKESRSVEEPTGRYAISRPPPIFADDKPKSIFGGDELIGEKSLDEVILSYLAEDLEQK